MFDLLAIMLIFITGFFIGREYERNYNTPPGDVDG